MKEIVLATKNRGKVKEFAALFQRYGMKTISLLDIEKSVPDIAETGTTFHENARLKAEGIADVLNKPVIADDSGLVVDALDGKPGVYSARYAGEPSDDVKNYEKLLQEMKDVPESKRTARFVCVLAVAMPERETIFTEGICEGTIAYEPKGTNGFGYDPVFIPKGYDCTMAQLEPSVKNRISHRYNALIKLEKWLKQQMNR